MRANRNKYEALEGEHFIIIGRPQSAVSIPQGGTLGQVIKPTLEVLLSTAIYELWKGVGFVQVVPLHPQALVQEY